MSPRRGLFVVVEGPEGSGKSTLVAGLAARMAAGGVTPIRVREPGGTAVAEAVRQTLLDPAHAVTPLAEMFLFLAARADVVVQIITPALEEGRVVLADRFALSTDIYQVVGRGLEPTLVSAANRAAVGEATPDLILVIDIPAGMGRERQVTGGLELDRLDQEHAVFHERVAAAYRQASGPGVKHLDGTMGPEDVLDAAWDVLRGRHPETFSPDRGCV